MSPDPAPSELARDIILAEYGYIAQTAFQANEDRARAWQYFFVTFATLIAALLSTQIEGVDQRQLYMTFVVIFALLAALGLITLLELVRLRQAWLESVRAMNYIKDRLVTNEPAAAAYFLWRTETIPAPFKVRSLGFLQAVSVALLSGLAVGAAVAFASLAGGGSVPWLISLLSGWAVAALLLWLAYIRPLQNGKPGGRSGAGGGAPAAPAAAPRDPRP